MFFFILNFSQILEKGVNLMKPIAGHNWTNFTGAFLFENVKFFYNQMLALDIHKSYIYMHAVI